MISNIHVKYIIEKVDQNLVKVGKKGFPEDYINASYIPFTNDDNIEYIASQGSINNSLSQFWQMIWEQNIDCIIMLTKWLLIVDKFYTVVICRTVEGNKFKCLQYWPNDINESISYGINDEFFVTLLEEDESESFIERNLNVQNMVFFLRYTNSCFWVLFIDKQWG